MEHPWTLWNEMEELWRNNNRGRTQGFYSVEKRINTSMALDFLFTRASWTLSWDVAQSPACLSSSPWGQSLSTSQKHQRRPQRQTMITGKQRNYMTSYRMSLIRHRRRTFLLCKETGMQKWARMLVETGKAFVDSSALMTKMRGDSDFWSLPPLTILCWRTLLVTTKHPEDGHGIAQMDNTTARLIIF